jgi:predicted nucleic acid-binding protein
MNVLVDTCIWSYALRRKQQKDNHYQPAINELTELIKESRVEILGTIRQEVLSGIKHEAQFLKVKQTLGAFPDKVLSQEDYELAAALFNQLRQKGIQGSNTDFLLCAVAINYGLTIFTDNTDFVHFKKHIPIRLHRIR